MPDYGVYPLSNGRCVIPGNAAFHGGDPAEGYPYGCYLWLILGGEFPVVVDTGLDDVEEMNRGAASVLKEPITQLPSESTRAQLNRFGLDPSDVGALIITHLHFDHVECMEQFSSARIYVSGSGLAKATANNWHGSWAPGKILRILTDTAADRVVAKDNTEVLPGIHTMWIGGHSPCSQAVLVETGKGLACLTGDTVSLMANLERNQAVGVYHDLNQCYDAMKTIRQVADIVLPSHEPGLQEKYPEGVGR